MMQRNTIHCMDWLELMRGLEAGSVDLVLSDLPYGVTACEWDTPIDLTVWWQECKRVLAPRGAVVMTATQPFTTDLIVSNRKWFRYEWIWDKKFGGNFVNAQYAPMKSHENILVFGDDIEYIPQMELRKTPIKGGGLTKSNSSRLSNGIALHKTYDTKFPLSVLAYPRELGLTVHPTQKPVDLFRYLIRTYTNPGALVVDPFVGSGTTAVAAKIEGRDYIVGDMSAEYCEIARRRVEPTFGEPPKRSKPELPLSDLPMFRDLE